MFGEDLHEFQFYLLIRSEVGEWKRRVARLLTKHFPQCLRFSV